jgi:hypothetical protein
MSSWLTSILETVRGKKPAPEVPKEPGVITTILPCTICFVYRTPTISESIGTIVRAYSKEWTGCKGGSGFELNISQTRIKACNAKGTRIVDMKYSLPMSLIDTNGLKPYFFRLSLSADKFNLEIIPYTDSHLEPVPYRASVVGLMPSSATIFIGNPKGIGTIVKGSSVETIEVVAG